MTNARLVVTAIACHLLLAACTSEEAKQLALGEEIVVANCKVCHAMGINGAPMLGNSPMWSPRAAQGESVLVEHAMSGFGLMPAKGGNESLTEPEITAAVKYMLSLAQQ